MSVPGVKLALATLWVAALVLATSCASRDVVVARPVAATATVSIERLEHDVCGKRIVLLGEDANHGGGATLDAKTAVVTHLIDDCHFDVVLFEASFPEFVDANRALSADGIADAIGGTWSVAGESDALVAALYVRAQRKQITLGGLDGQLGSTNGYVQSRMPGELAGYVADKRRAACQAELQRYARYDYDDAHPLDDATRTRLRDCFTEIAATAGGPHPEVTEMAVTLRAGLDDAGRDAAMYQALQWHVAHLPSTAKIVVWCATVHAAKNGDGSLGSFVHRDFGDTAAAIGISALAGSFGRRNHPATALAPAAPDSLEARAFANATSDLVYLSGAELAQPATARALDYTKPAQLAWSDVVDGLLVLRAERVPTFTHDPQPRRR